MAQDGLNILQSLCNLPVAPYCEQHVIAWILAWAAEKPRAKQLRVQRDRAGDIYLHYRRGKQSPAPLIIEAHLDHPGFVLQKVSRTGIAAAEFRGSVRPSHFAGARAKFWLNDPPAVGSIAPVAAKGRWIPAKVLSVSRRKNREFLDVKLQLPPAEKLPAGSIGMWDLPDAFIKNDLFCARGCDDLGGVSAALCMLDELITKMIDTHVIVLLTRAEEVGFAGAIAVAQNGWIPKRSPVIGLETSKAFPTAPQGAGPIVHVGDKTGIFSAGLTHFITQAAATINDDDSTFHFQRKLLDGGTCNATTFLAFGYDSAAICIGLGNYHNQTIRGDAGWRDGVKAGPGIASETIHLGDFAAEVRLLVQIARTIGNYRPNFGVVRERLVKRHQGQQALLYAKR
jgi:putative aminopeptidase FrvX